MKKRNVIALMVIISLSACTNNSTDDTRTDTTVLAPPAFSPLPDTSKTVDSATATRVDSTAVATAGKNNALSESKKTESKKIESKKTVSPADKEADVRVKKVSRKGRIILQLLKENMQDKIEADKEGVYARAEVPPLYQGGETALRDFIERHIQYPDNAINNDVQGTVKVYFSVDEQGNIIAPAVISPKLGYGLEEEALRVVKQMPKWIPGQVKGKNVKTRFTLPITYRIE